MAKKDLALLFDFGGVISESPFVPLVLYATSVIQQAFVQGSVRFDPAEAQPNLFGDMMWFSKEVRPPGLFQKLETGVFSRSEFVAGFADELNLFLRFLSGIEMPHPAQPSTSFEAAIRKIRMNYSPEKFTPEVCAFLRELVDGESFLSCAERVPIRTAVVSALPKIKALCAREGIPLTIGIVTNNWQQAVNMKNKKPLKGESASASLPPHLEDTSFTQFLAAHLGQDQIDSLDFVTESVVVGASKPSSGIYTAAMAQVRNTLLSRGGSSTATPAEVLFMDDLPYNLTGAMKAQCGVSSVARIKKLTDIFDAVLSSLHTAGASAAGILGLKADMTVTGSSAVGGRIYIKTLPDRVITAIPEKQQFSPEELEKLKMCLIKRLPHHFAYSLSSKAHSPLQVEYFKGGMSNPTFRLTTVNGSYVLRKQPKGKLLKGAHDMRREYELFTFLGTRGIPVPKTFAYVSDSSIIGTPFYMMRYTCGHIMRTMTEMTKPSPAILTAAKGDAAHLEKLVTQNIANFFSAAVKGAAKLHQAGVPDYLTKGKALIAPTDPKRTPLFRLVSTWQKQYVSGNKRLDSFIAGGGKPEILSMRSDSFEELTQQLTAIITEAMPCPEKLVLTHGDFKIDNMIFDLHPREVALGHQLERGPSLLALLDFELSAVGDPITDIAYCSLYHFLPHPRGIFGIDKAKNRLFPTGQQMLEQYCAETGHWANFTPERRLQLLYVYQAVMLQKLSGIMHGVVVRALVGNASDIKGGLALHPAFELLIDTALGLVEASGLRPKPSDSKL